MKWANPYETLVDKINSLEWWIIIHSCLYYELNDSIVTDKFFDANCKQLLELIELIDFDHSKLSYHYVFGDFDGNTGFDLYHRLSGRHKERAKHAAYRM